MIACIWRVLAAGCACRTSWVTPSPIPIKQPMPRIFRSPRVLVASMVLSLPGIAGALTLDHEKATYSALSSESVTMTGHSELLLTGTGDPLPGCTIHLNSTDSWVFLTGVSPSSTVATLISRFRVNGATAVVDTNVRVVQYVNGSVVIPQPPTYQPLRVFTGRTSAERRGISGSTRTTSTSASDPSPTTSVLSSSNAATPPPSRRMKTAPGPAPTTSPRTVIWKSPSCPPG